MFKVPPVKWNPSARRSKVEDANFTWRHWSDVNIDFGKKRSLTTSVLLFGAQTVIKPQRSIFLSGKDVFFSFLQLLIITLYSCHFCDIWNKKGSREQKPSGQLHIFECTACNLSATCYFLKTMVSTSRQLKLFWPLSVISESIYILSEGSRCTMTDIFYAAVTESKPFFRGEHAHYLYMLMHFFCYA